jgi:hypothetical protein
VLQRLGRRKRRAGDGGKTGEAGRSERPRVRRGSLQGFRGPTDGVTTLVQSEV